VIDVREGGEGVDANVLEAVEGIEGVEANTC
jgi:hypothetical protein